MSLRRIIEPRVHDAQAGGAALLLALVFFGCSQDDEAPPPPPNATFGSGGAAPSNLGGAEPGFGGENAGGAGLMLPETGDVCDAVVCGTDQACEEVGGIGVCTCSPELGGKPCGDVDECATEDNACDEHATCVDAEDFAVCTCEPGRFGDGTYCKLANACQGAPCGSGTCRNTLSGYSCSCPLGSTGQHCDEVCPTEEPIAFASPILEAAVRASTGIFDDITPSALAGHTALHAPPPDDSPATDDEIFSLEGLQCWTTVQSIHLAGHALTNIEAIASLGALTSLDLTCTDVQDLSPLSSLALLHDLRLANNALCSDQTRDNLSLAFLTDLTGLRTLDLEGSGIITSLAPLSSLRRLEQLNLESTELASVTGIEALVSLRELSIKENPLDCAAAQASLSTLQSRGVVLQSPCQ